ncbi:MAG: DUF732 domain-containing protein [Mycolicibacterium neoaurum]|uniref:DUF732 domain-containing protein n=1 Tax=Mycolicibacterium neoaurum TaxID=1795 RepID=UPI002FF47A10
MRNSRIASMLAAGAVVAALAVAPVAQADRDEAFADQLHSFGIYGQKDFNAWIAKIMCKRLHRGVDADVFASAKFVHGQLQTGSSTEQAWQFVGAGIPAYCPELTHLLARAGQKGD